MRIEVPIGDTGRVIFSRRTNGSVILESKPGKGVVRGKLNKRESILDDVNTQVVTNLEGNSATIYIGQHLPFTKTENFRTGNTVFQVQST